MGHRSRSPLGVPLRQNRRYFFSDPNCLTLDDKLVRGQMAERAVRPAMIIVHTPGFNDGLGISERRELVHVQTFVSQAAVE